jgi:hypothetical protein
VRLQWMCHSVVIAARAAIVCWVRLGDWRLVRPRRRRLWEV